MLIEKVVKMLSQLIMMILMARFLGPEELGSLMYCFAIASIFIFLNTLGLDSILVKILVERVNKQYSFLKHALILRLIGAVCSIVLINIAGLWLVDDSTRLLLFIISLYHLFMPFNVYEWFYQAQGRGDLSAYGLIAGHISGFLFRLICLLVGGDLIWLGAAYVIEMAVMALCFMSISKKQKMPNGGQLSAERMKNLFKDASPLIISGALVLLYMKVDQLMLGYMVDNAEVGIYVAATRLSEAWYFIGLTLIGVYFPKLIETLKNEGQLAYESEVVNKSRWLIWGAIGLAVITSFISTWLILTLYGQDYIGSATVLTITIWAVPFVYLGTISTKMYIALGNVKSILYRSLIGFFVNLLCNLALIPEYGAVGAGVATLIAQAVSSYFVNFILGSKDVFLVQTKIICPINIVKRDFK